MLTNVCFVYIYVLVFIYEYYQLGIYISTVCICTKVKYIHVLYVAVYKTPIHLARNQT
jgi:hypothetical protein